MGLMRDAIEIKVYRTDTGKSPYLDWEARQSRVVRARVLGVLTRLRRGNSGLAKTLKGGLYELRLHDGPGYRIYFGKEKECVVLLLCAGEKRSQERDIDRARKLWEEYRSSTKNQGGQSGKRK